MTAPKILNILIADDEKAITTSVSLVLKLLGYSVDAVLDGGEALSRLTELPDHYHILITDHAMFKVSGLDLVDQLRKTDFQGRILVLSGYLTQELEEAYHSLGVDKVIRKPFDLLDLRNAVNELTQH